MIFAGGSQALQATKLAALVAVSCLGQESRELKNHHKNQNNQFQYQQKQRKILADEILTEALEKDMSSTQPAIKGKLKDNLLKTLTQALKSDKFLKIAMLSAIFF